MRFSIKCHGIDTGNDRICCYLYQCELRVIGRFTKKLSIDSDQCDVAQSLKQVYPSYLLIQ